MPLRVGILGLLLSASALAQSVYRAEQADGVPSYSDRPPDGLDARIVSLGTDGGAAAGVELELDEVEGAAVLVARNNYHGPVQIALYHSRAEYAAGKLPLNGLPVLPPRSETPLWSAAGEAAAAARPDYYLLYIPGDPRARHAADRPYRLPYAVATRHLVSQAYPERITHRDPSSEHAVDFEMPVGTGVFAARGGIVMDVAGDYYRSGIDDAEAPANMIRILHPDGTMAVYAHLQWNSIAVAPGDRVARGQRIADSGNTGFSTGPHLHFVVQRNRGGAIVSVPLAFVGAGGGPVEVHSGDEPTAY